MLTSLRRSLRPLACLMLATGGLAAQVTPFPPPLPPAGPVVLLADRALDGRGNELTDLRIEVAHGRIASLRSPRNGPAIDLRGYTVLPGWIDTHVHLESHWDPSGRVVTEQEPPLEMGLGAAGAAWETLMAGFTTVQNAGDPADRALRDAIRDRAFPGPRILTSLAWVEPDSTATPEQLRALVRQRKADGADFVKIFASSSQRVGARPTLSESQLTVLCREARALGLRSMVHAYRSQVGAAARAGCDQVEHATYATQADLDAAARAGTFISPQVGLVVQNYIEHQARYLGTWNYTEEGMAIMLRDLPLDFEICRLAVATPGARVVFSTDATAGAHGRNAEEFLGRVEHCGQSTMEALVSASALAAEAVGLGDRIGTLAPGYEADLIALDGDPLTDPTAVRRVAFVMRGGVIYKWAPVR